MEKAEKEFSGENEDWLKQLEYEKRSTVVKNTLRNLLLILNNDEKLKGIVFNQLSDGMEIKGEVPWEHPSRFWEDLIQCTADILLPRTKQKNAGT